MNKIFITTIIFTLPWSLQAQNTNPYKGSSFQEVLGVITNPSPVLKSQKEIEEFAAYQKGELPYYPVNALTVFSTNPALTKDAQRTVSEKFDYYDYLPKKLHANGVCLVGQWKIDKASSYSGYFKKGSRGLFIGRASVTMGNVLQGSKRGFGFAGKLFPTTNETEIVKTASFFAVDVLLGTKTDRFLETSMTNQPETGFSLSALGLGLRIASALKKADEDPSFRPVTPISRLGEAGIVKTPHWIKVSAVSNLIKNNEKDFRNELMKASRDNQGLTFDIAVSDRTSDRTSSDWEKIGQIKISKAFISYGCDRQLHFAHPRLKD